MKRKSRYLAPEERKRRVKVFLQREVLFVWRITIVSGNGRILEIWHRMGRRRAASLALSLAEVYGGALEARPRKRHERRWVRDKRQLPLPIPDPPEGETP